MTTEDNDFSNGTAYVDGQIVPVSEAKISVLDWGFLHSDATYDVVHVWEGNFFRLDDHIDRFFNGMDKFHLSISYGKDEVKSILIDCVRKSKLRDAYVEIICTRGMPKPGSRDPRNCTNRFIAFAIPFVWIACPEKQAEGLSLVISDIQRISPLAVDPTIKNYHWLDLVMALFQAYDQGSETAVVVDGAGNIVEGPGFNFFVVKGNTIVTPDRGMLEGITRKTVIELVSANSHEMQQRPLAAEEARSADEVFITSTAGGIMPVTKIDGKKIGDGLPGPVTMKLRASYWKLHRNEAYRLAIDYGQ
ncbi:MAG: aminotransferase class IV [Desulfobacterales bacterium]|nr:aminotransferase class IV [Desulfobacterales bacterium]